jgi:hypothetical protein
MEHIFVKSILNTQLTHESRPFKYINYRNIGNKELTPNTRTTYEQRPPKYNNSENVRKEM